MKNQKGFIKEVIIIAVVIFLLAYFSIDHQHLVDKFMEWFNSL